ncbi:ABC transporter permease [Paenibacillus sp. 1011MAR3C5]|uniref:ABC transporter permease n=1 Tax=Paenibacillus sp. 1011MAR3C5 TaxID=1675787 RepID=UPI000E6C0A81|nr:ABC transporter permease [Paenibacillus sp. 1011MAR3C5]RJE87527.1 ABC transporter permease [Paenibacillus sp. 1011MAR3C5]
MMQLIKLEFKKGRMTGYLWGSLITYGVILGFLLLIYMVEGPTQEEPIFQSNADMLSLIDTLIRATFIIYASVLLSKLVIGEFQNKTMALLFAYPVSRKKLLTAKLSMVFVWTLANVIIANFVIGTIFLTINANLAYVPDTITSELLINHGTSIITNAIAAAGMSLLPLTIGMRKKSVPSTIVTAVLLVMLVCSNNMGFSLGTIIAIPLSLGALGILLTLLSIRNIDRVDVA